MGFAYFYSSAICILIAVLLSVEEVSNVKAFTIGCAIGSLICGVYWIIKEKSSFE